MEKPLIIVPFYILAAALFKLAWIVFWSYKMKKKHDHSLTWWFKKMFYPQTANDMPDYIWSDYKYIQRVNLISNIVLLMIGILIIIVIVTLKAQIK